MNKEEGPPDPSLLPHAILRVALRNFHQLQTFGDCDPTWNGLRLAGSLSGQKR
jgi:hypothetical protein